MFFNLIRGLKIIYYMITKSMIKDDSKDLNNLIINTNVYSIYIFTWLDHFDGWLSINIIKIFNFFVFLI